jgi:hypothetical protein
MNHSVQLKSAIPPELVEEFLKRLPYISESLLEYDLNADSHDQVRFALRPGGDDQAAIVSSRIVEVAEKLLKTRRAPSVKVLASHINRNISFDADPHPLLESMDELHRYGAGRYGFGPRLVQLISLFEREVCAIAEKYHAPVHQFPTLIGADLLHQARYLRSFPSSLSMVSHLREDMAAIQDFAKVAGWDGERLVHNPESLHSIQCLLSPSVCFHYYSWLKDRVIDSARITAVGKCFRYESRNMDGLERLWDFTMREIIFLGASQFVLDHRDRMIDETVALLDRWELSFEIRSASDPFFIDDYASMATFQLAFDLKFEILAPLPYRRKDLAIGSFNYHQDFFGRSFNITGANRAPVHTGCTAFGLERVALAFLAQHGVDSAKWPAAVADQIGKSG